VDKKIIYFGHFVAKTEMNFRRLFATPFTTMIRKFLLVGYAFQMAGQNLADCSHPVPCGTFHEAFFREGASIHQGSA
jgi:hypothetical protein